MQGLVALALGLVLASGIADAGGAPDEILLASGPARASAGSVDVGQTLLTVPVRHRLTGRLANRITLDSVFGRDAPLEAGQPVVEPGPALLPPMTLSLALEDIQPDPEGGPGARRVDLDLGLDWGEGAQVIGRLPVIMTAGGGAAKILGLTLRLAPGPGPGQIRVVR